MCSSGPLPLIDLATTALNDLKVALSESPEEASCHVFLYANRGRGKSDKWKRLRFTSGLATTFRTDLEKQLVLQLPPLRILTAFSFDDMVNRQIGVIAKDEIPEIEKWFDEVPPADWLHLFDGDEKFLANVKFHVTNIAVADQKKSLKLFRQRSRTSLLHKGGYNTIFNFRKNEFSEVDGKIFDFSLDVDFFEWQGFVFILHLPSFESLTEIRRVTLTRAQDAISSLSLIGNLVIEGLESVSRELDQKPLLAKKLAAAKRQGTIDALKAEALVSRIAEKNLPISTRTLNGTYTIVIDPTQSTQISEFVNLITDFYLRSPVTQKEYKAHAKEAV